MNFFLPVVLHTNRIDSCIIFNILLKTIVEQLTVQSRPRAHSNGITLEYVAFFVLFLRLRQLTLRIFAIAPHSTEFHSRFT